jgi:hypothetical protein
MAYTDQEIQAAIDASRAQGFNDQQIQQGALANFGVDVGRFFPSPLQSVAPTPTEITPVTETVTKKQPDDTGYLPTAAAGALPASQLLIPQYSERQSAVKGYPVVSHYLDPNTGRYYTQPTIEATTSSDKIDVTRLPSGVTGINPDDNGQPTMYASWVPADPNNPRGSGTYKSWDSAGNPVETKSFGSLITGGGGLFDSGILGAISNVVHDVGTAVAQNPILSSAAYVLLVSNGVPPAAATALVQANAGASPEQILKSAAVSGLVNNYGSDVTSGVKDLTGSTTLATAAVPAATSFATTLASGKSLGQAFQNAAITGGLAGAFDAIKNSDSLPEIKGMTDLQKKAFERSLTASLQGKDPLSAGASTFLNDAIRDAVREAKAESGLSTTKTASTDTGGINVASTDTGTVSDAGTGLNVTVSGRPIFAEDERAGNLKTPFGYDVMPASMFDAKPAGAYYDNILNAWLMPNDDVQKLNDVITSQSTDRGLSSVTGEKTNADGSSTYTYDDGSTLTLDRDGNVTGSTSATDLREGTGADVTVTGSRDTDTDAIDTNRSLDTVTVTDKKDEGTDGIDNVDNTVVCGEGYHEENGICVPDDDTKTDPTNCPEGYIYDFNAQACVPVDTTIVKPPIVVKPPVVTTTTPKTTTTTSPLSAASSWTPEKLSSSPQFLAGAPVYQKARELEKLQQLFASLTPELQAALASRGIEPPRREAPKESETVEDVKLPKYEFMASGGLAGIANELNPKIQNVRPTFLEAAPIPTSKEPSRLGALKHIGEGVLKGSRIVGGLAHGGELEKYEKAAPKGHKPEFITGLTGYYADGRGTGQSDDIPAMLHDGDYVIDADAVAALGDGSSKAGAKALSDFQSKVPHEMSTGGEAIPAKIADGEYVFPAAFVSALGGGDNKRGAKMLDAMREELREHKRSAPTSKIPPKAKSPLDYLKMAKG